MELVIVSIVVALLLAFMGYWNYKNACKTSERISDIVRAWESQRPTQKDNNEGR